MSQPAVLVTGGAGYIGSVTCKLLSQKGFTPVVIDNLSLGHADFVKWGPLVQADIWDEVAISDAIHTYKPLAVLHFAALSNVGDSVKDPNAYFQNNVSGSLRFLDILVKHGISCFVFSSTAATYGEPESDLIDRDHKQNPINPYGLGKLMIETALKDYDKAHGLRSVSFRYFNAAGADPEGDVGENHNPETHLIPLALQAVLGQRASLTVFGEDYPTPDGTCIRDYIHVHDLAMAHVLALESLLDGAPTSFYNLGNGQGFSVKEVLSVVQQVTGKEVPHVIGDRRAGDPACLVADASVTHDRFNWTIQYPDLDCIVQHAWDFITK